ncbi:argininosuccinate lyase [bacterium]|nr:argininosuccinate lyase [bacterium]
MKLWQKKVRLDPRIEAFTVGDDPELDQNLVAYDCIASIAHAKTLKKAGILSAAELARLTAELKKILDLHKKGKFRITRDQEDCHTAIEQHLTRRLGDLGKKIHTARSRNDQVLAAMRLYMLDRLNAIGKEADAFMQALAGLKKRRGRVRYPGYTHTRKAMVSSVALWCDAFIESMRENIRLLALTRTWIDQSPLGTGAGYGIPLIELDRELTAREAGFSRVQKSPVFVQNSRGKFESLAAHLCVQIMMDLNRAASDLILFSLPALGYFELPESLCTGSSIMPQKKNPDVLELVRAKFHETAACGFQIQSTTAGLISGYHRDLQLTKKPVMQCLDITARSLGIMSLVIRRLRVNEARCKADLTEEVFAAEKAYALVQKGVPFREAYRRIAEQLRSS